MGNMSGSYGSHYTLWQSITTNSQNIENNTSNVTVQMYLSFDGSSYYAYTNYNTSGTMTINGSELNYSISNINFSSGVKKDLLLATWTGNINHNSDGTKTLNVSGYWNTDTTRIGSGSCSASSNLATIPRASAVSGGSGTIGSETTISITRASQSFTHNLYFSLGNISWQSIASGVGDSYIWTIPTNIYNQMPNTTTTTGTLICETYNNGTYIGAKTSTFTVYTSESACKPTVSATIKDVNSGTINLTGSSAKLIRYHSTAELNISSGPRNGASIRSITVNGTNVGTNINTVLQYGQVNTNTFTIVVTDSRGYSTIVEVSPSYVEYVPLTLSARFYRPRPTTGEMYLTYSGNYFNGNFGATSNYLTIVWEYKKQSDSTWTRGGTITPTISGNTISYATISLGNDFDYKTSYDFYIYAADKLMSTQVVNNVTVGRPIFSWLKNLFIVNSNRLRLNSTGQTGDAAFYEIWKNGSRAAWFGFGNNDDNRFYINNETGSKIYSFSPFEWQRAYASNADANGYATSGTWYFTTGCSNIPSAYSTLFVNGAENSTDTSQLATYVSSGKTWVRGRSNGTWHPWLHLLGAQILYYNNSGTTGTVTLSEDASQFSYLEIFYGKSENYYNSTRVIEPQGKNVSLITGYFNNATPFQQVLTKTVLVSGTSISTVSNLTGLSNFYTGNSHEIWNSDEVKIYCVVGYK